MFHAVGLLQSQLRNRDAPSASVAMHAAGLGSSSWRERRDACQQLRGSVAKAVPLQQILALWACDVDRDVRRAAGEVVEELRRAGEIVRGAGDSMAALLTRKDAASRGESQQQQQQ